MPREYNFERIKVLVTSACNSNCTHCFRKNDKNTKMIPQEKLIEIVDFAVDKNCNNLSFSGGEFFTHPFAYGLIDYCLSKKLNVSILTNALDINIPYFKNVIDKKRISFQVSIDGLQELHDLRRGKGTYRTTINNVQSLYNLGFKISAKTVLDEYNYKDIINILELPYFSEFLVLPVAITDSAYESKISNEIIDEYEKIIPLIYQKISMLHPDMRTCNCFPEEIAIKYDGNVYPCTEAREHDEYVMGNVMTMTLSEVIEQYEGRNYGKLECKGLSLEKCSECKSKDICNKGCRLRAKHFFGDFNAPDPFNCRIFNSDYSNIPVGKLFWGIK